MKIEDCPRFDRCSAPICPLDRDWRLRKHLSGEPICAYLREAAKQGGKLPLNGENRPISGDLGGYISREPDKAIPAYQVTPVIPYDIRKSVNKAYTAIRTRFTDIRRRLDRAATSPSRLGKRPPVKKHHASG